jgi:hypothetical protein
MYRSVEQQQEVSELPGREAGCLGHRIKEREVKGRRAALGLEHIEERLGEDSWQRCGGRVISW